ncbi:SGNH/GDSL hydrolase family protein [Mucilaginibacter sp. X5P1]|uniref:SGNH/GDSL hydrolase family protein n=1 Tax=Mucilaginibacter sp. X5P1 TaxID=2723088 RepID=UPI001608E161|nr:SGNH/GDSL hydrolase family protein [Mucilaginibacter sp. X5P1]MBB6138704.1 lysophospholipase L1-like esterase [Mucilaginibacter sp. X5P1]
MYKKILVCTLISFSVIKGYSQAKLKPFTQGDRVVFMGNSITDGGHYHSYIWLYYMTHFPNMRIDCFNAGIGGDVSKQMLERLNTDVFVKRPTVMTLTFGMNDTGYELYPAAKADSVYQQKVKISLQSFELIKAELQQHPEIKKIMIASSPYDETSKIKIRPLLKKNTAMLVIAAEQQKTSKENNWGFVDFNTPMTMINQREQRTDSTFTMQDADRIHPTNDGQMVMAYVFLNAQGLAGTKVADMAINAKNNKIEQQSNCKITGLIVNSNTTKFTYLANSLPYPLDTIPSGFGRPERSQAQALKLIPFINDYDQEMLRVKGLDQTKAYALTIDGKAIGAWDGKAFVDGINLALLTATPQYQQSLAIMHLNEERWEIERRLREYYWIHYSILKPKGLLFNDSEATMDSLQKYARKDFFVGVTIPTYQKARFKSVRDAWQKEMDLLTDQIYQINKPVAHNFEIRLVN